MNKIFKKITAFVSAAALTAGIMPAALAADENIYTLSNDYIKVDVSGKNGGFHIDTVQGDKLEKDDDNKMLLHNSDEYDTSFTSFRITSGEETNDYIFGRNYGFLGLSGTDISTVQEGDSRIISTWTAEDIEFTQTIELANASSSENGMVIISYSAKNNGAEAVDDIHARIMLDTALGYQDYAYYKIPQDGTYVTVENEQIIDGASYGHMMFGYDDEFVPSVTAYTVNASVDAQECVPESVAFGHWNNLAATVYDFTPNEALTFTNEYNAQYLTADSAYALYFGMGALQAGEASSIATNYGVYSNAGTSMESKLAINISGADPMQLNADKTAYISPNEGDSEGEITLTANIKNFEKENASEIDTVRLAVYPDEMITPIDDNGSTESGNGETYSAENLYTIDFIDVAVEQTITKDMRFKVPVNDTATYRKIEFAAYEPDPDSDLLLQENIIGRQSVYILCPGTDNGVPEVVLTGCTEHMYYTGKQRLCATGLNLNMLSDAGSYNFRLEEITENGKDGAVINIDSSNTSIDEVNNTIDITVPAPDNEKTGETGYRKLGNYRLVIDYIDEEMQDVVSDAAKVIVTNDAKYNNSGYGIVTVEQTVQPSPDIAACEYEVKTYRTEEEYKEYLEANPDAEILVELKGDFSEERKDDNGNAYYQATVITSGSEPTNPITLNQTMELRSGEMRVTVEKYNSNGTEKNQSILVDVDGDMRMAGTGTVVFDGSYRHAPKSKIFCTAAVNL